ncbi:DUF4112 domain-containing protein [Aliiglaciecola litoralis]|uniref:DUF4112 domain-containing protein n=1 Tax=Aliiglaciecola litoralis TaxID=582857 RepID=A0ABN1LRX9_9ALTE
MNKQVATTSGKISVPNQLLLAQKIANLTDTAVRIPFTNIKLGLDSLIGLIPGVGDTVMLGVSASIIVMGKSMGLPRALLIKMIRNSIFDFLLGLIPILGDIVDIFYKANLANVRIMEKWWVVQNKAHLDANAQQQLEDWERKNL